MFEGECGDWKWEPGLGPEVGELRATAGFERQEDGSALGACQWDFSDRS